MIKNGINADPSKLARLLSICCTYRRPDMIAGMLKSFDKTKTKVSDMIIYLHDDDPKLEQYEPCIAGRSYILGEHRNLQQVLNYISMDVFDDYDYYQIICDDHIYHTEKWDEILVNTFELKSDGWGFACGRDLINGDNWSLYQHPSAEIWSGKQAKTIGYAYPRNMGAMHLDYYTKSLGLAVGGLVFVPEVVIEHLWYGGCSKPADENIKEKYNEKHLAKAQEQFDYWKNNEMSIAVEKIKQARGW